MVFSTEDLVLIKVFCQEKRLRQLSHCFIRDNCEHVVSETFGRVIENVIKYNLYIKFPGIFAHNVQICAKLCCKNLNDVCQVFRMLQHYI